MQPLPDAAKRRAAEAAITHVKDGMIVGLGSGTTAAYAIIAIGERKKHESLPVLRVFRSLPVFKHNRVWDRQKLKRE